jgi:hypothetical protein
MNKFTATLTGVRPLLMHNAQLADPTSKWTQELAALTKAKNKTLEQHIAIRRVEWYGGLYLDDDNRPAIPGENLVSMLVLAARKVKKGKQFQAGVVEAEPWFTLEHEGPADLADLYADPAFSDYRSVVVSGRRIMRCRARFFPWKLKVSVLFDPQLINSGDVAAALVTAGECIGLGDRRPQFGRFTVTK